MIFSFVAYCYKTFFCIKRAQKFLEQGDKHQLPNLSIDITIIGYTQHDLKCLLLEMEDKCQLPSGYFRNEESVNDDTLRILKEIR